MKKNLLLALGSLFFSLLLIELCLQVVSAQIKKPQQRTVSQSQASSWVDVPEKKWVEYHPLLGWFPRKNIVSRVKTPYVDAGVQTNHAGIRGTREYALKKPAGVTRVIAIGDSFTFGFGVEDNQVFTHLLEAKNPKLEVLNFGVAGYGIDQVSLLYREIAEKYEADYVLIGVYHEDFWRATRAFTDGGYAKPYFEKSSGGKLELKNVPVPHIKTRTSDQFPELFKYGPLEQILRRSILYRFFEQRIIRLLRKLKVVDPDLSPDWILGRDILQDLIREIRATGAEPIMMIVPPESWVHDSKKNQQRRSLIRFAERNQTDCIDLTASFYEAVSKAKTTDYFISGDWHWTAKGHALAASEVAGYLTAKTLKSGQQIKVNQ